MTIAGAGPSFIPVMRPARPVHVVRGRVQVHDETHHKIHDGMHDEGAPR
jgi:hypothetical protein